jgi:hypothetical protein
MLVVEERMTKARTTSPLTRNQKKKMSEVPSEVKLRKIVPEVPRDEVERGELLEELTGVGETPESRILREPKEGRKIKSPERKMQYRVTTSGSKGESGSEREEVPVLDLDPRMG